MDFFRKSSGSSWTKNTVVSRSSYGSYQPLIAPAEELELNSSDPDRDVLEDEKYTEAAEELEVDSQLEDGFSTSRKRPKCHPIFESAKSIAFTVFVAIIPSFLNFFEKSKPRKLHKTAWLDGLRGVAALMVVCHHSSVLWYYSLNRGWGSSATDYHFVQLPIIRLAMSGSSNVAIFFVVSGFSLGYKPLQLIRRGDFPGVLRSLGSSVVRRGMRLVMPPAFVTFFSMLAAYFNLYGVGPGSRQPPMSPFFWENLKSWYYSVVGLADPFRPRLFPGGYNPVYDTNLWTIPVEFYGSMVIFTIILAVSKLRRPYRLAVLIGTVLYLNYYAYSHLFLFISGILLCEIHHIRQDSQIAIALPDSPLPTSSPTITYKPHFTPWKALKGLLWTIYTLLSLHVLSMPMMDFGGAASPGFKMLARYIPYHYHRPYVLDTFWVFLAAVNVVFIIDSLPLLQAIFTTRLAQYLGKISFAIYICHGTLLYTLGYKMSGWIHSQPSLERVWIGQYDYGYGISIALTGCVLYPLLFWMSDLVARGVDAKSVKFARWVNDKISV